MQAPFSLTESSLNFTLLIVQLVLLLLNISFSGIDAQNLEVVSVACNETIALKRITESLSEEEQVAEVTTEDIREKAEAIALLQSTSSSTSSSTLTLRPPQETVDEINTLLQTILQEKPELGPIYKGRPHSGLPWIPGEILVGFNDEAQEELEAGTYNFTAIDAVNEELGMIESEPSITGFRYIIYRFDTAYNPEALVSTYQELPGVAYAEPNRVMNGGPSRTIEINDDGGKNNHHQFIFTVGWGDCFSGCIYEYAWSVCIIDDTSSSSASSSSSSPAIYHEDKACIRDSNFTGFTCPEPPETESPSSSPETESPSSAVNTDMIYSLFLATISFVMGNFVHQ